jgi:ectoine hydroxylase-related dioxygenase (phytanoyl-CoA dioxygenase family)
MAITIPPPIDPSYKPSVSIAKLPATAPIEDILQIIERDGGIILTDFTTPEDLAAIDADVEAHRTKTRSTEGGALSIIPKETLAMPGLVGKSPTVARICGENPVLEELRCSILEEKFKVIREEAIEENVIDPLLSISITLHIGYGAPRQTLHRDDNVHGIKHGGKFDLKKVSQFGCLIAGTRTTRQNGATMFVPGSHKWDDVRRPRLDEVCFAGMSSPLPFIRLLPGVIVLTATRNAARLSTHLPRILLPRRRP